MTAACLNIPLVHLQGEEVTGSIDEKVRHAVTRLADIQLVASGHAATPVIRMGERKDRVFVTGCPSIVVAASVIADDTTSLETIIDRCGGVGDEFAASQSGIMPSLVCRLGSNK